MNVQTSKFFVNYFKGIDLPGSLSTGYYSGSTIKPAFATEYEDKKVLKFCFGYSHSPRIPDIFYPCPIIIGSLQLYEMKVFDDKNNMQVMFEAMILQPLLPKISFTIELENARTHIIDIINFINLYLSNGKEHKSLKYSFLKRQENFKKFLPAQLPSITQDLKFKYFSGEIKRVGKDDVEYTGITIKNIPNNSYLAELIAKCVSQTSFVENSRWIPEKQEIVVSTDKRNDYSYSSESKGLILNMILINFFVYFKFEEYLIACHEQQEDL